MYGIADLAGLIGRHAPEDGEHATALPRVDLLRFSSVTEPLHTLYEPSCCLLAQGRKRAILGEQTHVYEASEYLMVGVDLPVIGAVVEASPEAPYLGIRLELNRGVLAELLSAGEAPRGEVAGLGLSRATPQLIDAAVRMLRLLDEPGDAAVLAPLVERELLHRLLSGPQGGILRQIAQGESRLNQIRKAIDFIRQNYRRAFAVEDLAAVAGMSPSSFYEHFRTITAMTPLQYRNRIRLQEARRLMVMEGMTAAEAGFHVGYDSPSQFSRDYARVHRVPPRRDVAQLMGRPVA